MRRRANRRRCAVPLSRWDFASQALFGSKDLISEISSVVAVEAQVSCELDSEVVILDLEGGIYYGLNSVGAHIWRLIQEPATVSAVCEALLQAYDVEPERCLAEVLALLDDLLAHGLIELRNGRH